MNNNFLKKPFTKITGKIISFEINDESTKKVTNFYKDNPFPIIKMMIIRVRFYRRVIRIY